MTAPEAGRGPGTLITLGMGPGDPELITLKAARILAASTVIAFFAARGRPGLARGIAGPHLRADVQELRFDYPFTTEISPHHPDYIAAMARFYTDAAAAIAGRLDTGQDVALLCEGDPFFYGSAMYVFDRLGGCYPQTIIPGITGMSGCWAEARLPITQGDDVLSVLPGTLDAQRLDAGLAGCDAAVIMKLGRNLPKIRAALHRAGRAEGAVYVERGTMAGAQLRPLAQTDGLAAPYFSMVLVPGRRGAR